MRFDSFSDIARRVFAATAFLLAAGAAASEAYPSKSIRIIVPVAEGSATDLMARELAPRLKRYRNASGTI